MRELILHADDAKQVRPWTRDLSVQHVRRNCKTAKELGSFLQGFVSKEPRGERLENKLARLFWQASIAARDAIGCGICRDKFNHLLR